MVRVFDGAISAHLIVITSLEVACTQLVAARRVHEALISRDLGGARALEFEIT
ncbi:MAG TPA: hypothetical protein VGH98_02730 [Gemmatimonadaceae bacterium]|jgi:hypothetical protein